jgi:hypothetical protein
MNIKYIIFKIDRNPIPSFYEYNLTSNYYYCHSPFKKGANPNESQVIRYPQIDSYYLQKDSSCSENNDQFLKYKKSKDIIILSCPFDKDIKDLKNKNDNLGISHFFKGVAETTMILKRNSPESIELLYIENPNEQNIRKIVEYLYNNYSFKILMVDDIGNNAHLIKAFPESFKIAYPVYHYIIGFKDKIDKENFFYYF